MTSPRSSVFDSMQILSRDSKDFANESKGSATTKARERGGQRLNREKKKGERRQTDRRSETLEARSSVDGDAQLDADDDAADGPETDATSSASRSARVVPKDAQRRY